MIKKFKQKLIVTKYYIAGHRELHLSEILLIEEPKKPRKLNLENSEDCRLIGKLPMFFENYEDINYDVEVRFLYWFIHSVIQIRGYVSIYKKGILLESRHITEVIPKLNQIKTTFRGYG